MCIFNCKLQCVKHKFKGLSGNYTPLSPFLWAAEQRQRRCLYNTSQKQGAVPDWGSGCAGRQGQPCRTQPYLSGEAPPQVHGTRASFIGLQPQHHCGGQLVMGSAATGLLLQVQGTRRDRDRRLKSSQSQMGAGLADPTATPLMQHSLSKTILSVHISLIF